MQGSVYIDVVELHRFLGAFHARSDAPHVLALPLVEVLDDLLDQLRWLGAHRVFQSPVHAVAHFVEGKSVLVASEGHIVGDVALAVLDEVLFTVKSENLVLELAPRPYGEINILGEGEFERQHGLLHQRAIAVARVVHLHVERDPALITLGGYLVSVYQDRRADGQSHRLYLVVLGEFDDLQPPTYSLDRLYREIGVPV